jgi:molybdate transport repressor ModE-like protein
MSKASDRLSLMATFVRIVERGSISAAARDLGLSQASASRQLAALEDRLGTQLIQRTTHELSLTAAGETCLAEARVLLQGWDSLAERLSETETELKGRLKVVAPVALGQGVLADIALRFAAQHPALQLDWTLSDDPVRFAEEGCDLWIRVGRIDDDALIVRPLGQIERLIVGVPGLVDAEGVDGPMRLNDQPFITVAPFEGGQITLTGVDGQVEMLRPPVAFATSNILTAHRGVLAGVGLAVMPRWLVAKALESGALIDVLPDWRAAQLSLQLAYLPARRQTRRLCAFIDFLIQTADDILGLI